VSHPTTAHRCTIHESIECYTMQEHGQSNSEGYYRRSKPRRCWPRDEAIPRRRHKHGEEFPCSRCLDPPASSPSATRAPSRTYGTRSLVLSGEYGRTRRRRTPAIRLWWRLEGVKGMSRGKVGRVGWVDGRGFYALPAWSARSDSGGRDPPSSGGLLRQPCEEDGVRGRRLS
jgi:hypothetical protein